MSKRWLQNLCIIFVFLLGLTGVILLGTVQGKRDGERDRQSLTRKHLWSEHTSSPEDTITVYVTKTGTKYHLRRDCSSLKKAKEITEVPLFTAENDGKECCARCGNE